MFNKIVRKKPQEANYTGRASLLERLCHVLPFKPASTRASDLKLGWCAAVLIGSVTASVPHSRSRRLGRASPKRTA